MNFNKNIPHHHHEEPYYVKPTFLQSSCLAPKYWFIQPHETGPVAQCVISVVFRFIPSFFFIIILIRDISIAIQKPIVKAPVSWLFMTKLLSIFILFAGCILTMFFWLILYKDEDYIVDCEASVEILQAFAWLLSGASLWLGYRRARKQSKSLRFYILIEFIMSCLLLYLRPRGVMDTLVDGKHPIFYIAFLDVVRVISLLILTILMSCWPRDVPKYSEIFIDYEEKLLLSSGEVSRTASYSSFGSFEPSPTTQQHTRHIKILKHALRKGSIDPLENPNNYPQSL